MADEPTQYTTISVTPEMQETLQGLKRGGQSYTDLLRSMTELYDQEGAPTG